MCVLSPLLSNVGVEYTANTHTWFPHYWFNHIAIAIMKSRMGRSPGALRVFSSMDYKNWWERNSFMYREEFGNKGIKSFLGRNVNQMEEPKIKDGGKKKEVAVS